MGSILSLFIFVVDYRASAAFNIGNHELAGIYRLLGLNVIIGAD